MRSPLYCEDSFTTVPASCGKLKFNKMTKEQKDQKVTGNQGQQNQGGQQNRDNQRQEGQTEESFVAFEEDNDSQQG